jgi:flavin reductase (DIM6/NTAB) family NADH-FMN oxidoreductase RutF
MKHFKEISPELIKKNPFHAIGKEWMLVTAGNKDKINTMTASWGGLGVMYGKNVAFVVIRPQRYTKEFIDREESFSLSFLDKNYRSVMNYLGTVSGRNEDKVAKSGLTVEWHEGVPYFSEANLILICKKLFNQTLEGSSLMKESLDSTFYPAKDYHTLYIAEVTRALQAARQKENG